MRITEIETHTICPPLRASHDQALSRYQGPDVRYRTVFVLHTDNGLEGLGEGSGKLAPYVEEWLARLQGTNPCDWLGHPALPIALAPAIYDLVGKHNDVPAYKLFGPKVRARVPIACWTVSQTPSRMAEAVQAMAAAGYVWLKFHTNHFHNVIAQTEAIQAVAPPGFKIHYDLNFDGTVEDVLRVAQQLARFPVAGAIEDPLRMPDLEGYRLLRQKSPLPIYFHHLPLGGREALLGAADGYMLGHSPVGLAIQRAGLYEAANVPFALQNCGGNITRGFVVHMASVFPMATLHSCTDCEQWAEDVVESLPVAGGTIAVPEGPGLGLTLDREALARWEATQPDPLPRALVRVRYAGLPPIYSRMPVHAMSNPFVPGPSLLDMCRPGYDHPVDLDFWDDDGSRDFADLWQRTETGPASQGDPRPAVPAST